MSVYRPSRYLGGGVAVEELHGCRENCQRLVSKYFHQRPNQPTGTVKPVVAAFRDPHFVNQEATLIDSVVGDIQAVVLEIRQGVG